MSDKEEDTQEEDDSKTEDVSPTIISSHDKEVLSQKPPNSEIVSYFLQFNCANCQSPIGLKSASASLKIKCPNCKKVNVFQ